MHEARDAPARPRSSPSACSPWAVRHPGQGPGCQLRGRPGRRADRISARITLDELDKRAAGTLARIEYERYEARRQALDEIVSERLLDEAARARGVTRDALLKAEIDDKVKPTRPTQQVRATYERAQGASWAACRSSGLEERIRHGAARAGAAPSGGRPSRLALRKNMPVQVLLEEPRARSAGPGAARPASGPSDAKVTIVEFLGLPVPLLPPGAGVRRRGAEAVRGQGPLRAPRLPARQAALAPRRARRALRRRAGQVLGVPPRPAGPVGRHERRRPAPNRAGALGLDSARFTACAATDRFDEDIQGATGAGAELGVSGTPTFFVNGRRAGRRAPGDRLPGGHRRGAAQRGLAGRSSD